MDPIVKNIIKQLKNYKPDKIILFGSYAYGKPNENSDVDLLVVKKTNEPFLKRQEQVRTLLRTTAAVDIFVFTPEEFEKAKQNNLLVKEVSDTGKIIYG